MKDIRPMAEERARLKREDQAGKDRAGEGQAGKGSAYLDQAGEAFISERARAKEAKRSDINTYTGENVRKIAAVSDQQQDDRILRVAAYCRVSTDDNHTQEPDIQTKGDSQTQERDSQTQGQWDRAG